MRWRHGEYKLETKWSRIGDKEDTEEDVLYIDLLVLYVDRNFVFSFVKISKTLGLYDNCSLYKCYYDKHNYGKCPTER